ncbi:MAG: S53 family peptidase, partial [Actinobacteria bacterium]|nr:S53 family peptidase [Actinomycetota bacterium]
MLTIRSRAGQAWIGAALLATVGLVASGAELASASAGPTVHRITVHPLVYNAGAKGPDVTFGCQTRPMDGSQGARCYQPAQIQNAYNITPLLNRGINGAGRTIVIVDAYGSPTIGTDLQTFDATFGLPDPKFKTIVPAGSPPPFDVNDPNQFGWSIETTLDVEWAHVTAPGAKIVLAVAASNNDSDILNTTKYVVDHNVGDVISQSFGEAEACMDPTLIREQHAVFASAVRKGITLFASSGDSGASQPSCDPNSSAALFAASTPASDPNVTGVGGTTLTADTSTGAYQSETAWTEPFGCNPPAVAATDVNCSGGGFSSIYPRPGYQAAVSRNRARGIPDVAYNAGVAGGVLFYSATLDAFEGVPPTSFFIVGGTSAGSPQWAGLAADADQLGRHRLGNINPALYSIAQARRLGSALHDITVGNNDVAELGGGGFNAVKGWDPVTGVGTPNAAVLLPLLAGRA